MAVADRPAVFLDRDGTIIHDRDYLGDPDGVELLPGAAEAIARLNRGRWPIIVVSNQSGIGRGLITEAQYEAVRARMEEQLAAAGARITATYHCPHDPNSGPACECRKPLPGMFVRAAREYGIDLSRSHYAGDRMRDILEGVRRGGTGYLIGSREAPPTELSERIMIVEGLGEVADAVLEGPDSFRVD